METCPCIKDVVCGLFLLYQIQFCVCLRQIDLLLHVIQKTVHAATYWKIHTNWMMCVNHTETAS